MSTSVLGAGDQASAVAAEASCASWRWDLHRACALSPRQCAAGLAIPLALSGAVGTVYAGTGFPLVALFVAAEWLAVALAFVVYARHARDGEWVTLADGELVIELRHAERTQTVRLNARWIRLAIDSAARQVECRYGGRCWSLGRYVNARRRQAFSDELARALRDAGAPLAECR